MEDETVRVKVAFSESAKEIMWVTNEIHDVLDYFIEEALKDSISSEIIGATARAIRTKLCKINNINIEKLFGTPKVIIYGGD